MWAEEALVTAVFCIIICGAWGTLSIRYSAPFLLEKVSCPHCCCRWTNLSWIQFTAKALPANAHCF